MGLLDGRVAIVTGGGRGIGRAHCVELAAQGAIVVVNDLGGVATGPGDPAVGASPADDVVAEIRAAGGQAWADATSVSDHDGIGRLVAHTVEAHGRLDVVVNNAGVLRDGTFANMTEDNWDFVLDVHLKGTFNLMKHAINHWRERSKAGETVHGRVINTTSGTGLFGNIGQANYGAAKAAIANLTMITAMEFERYGVTVNAISPIARTRMTENLPFMRATAADDDGWDRFDAANSAPVVAWLASESSGWLTGAVLRIDGATVLRVQPWSVDESTAYTARSGRHFEAAELDGGLRSAYRLLPTGIATVRR